jgi:hypothetical protein
MDTTTDSLRLIGPGSRVIEIGPGSPYPVAETDSP